MLQIEILFNGLIMGIFYSLMALGLSIIYGVLKIVNFAHGEFMMAGGYIFVLFTISLGINPIPVLFIVLIGGAIIGIIVEVLLIRPVYARYTEWRMMEARHEYSFIVTFALSILLVNLATAIFGPYSKKGPSLVMLERVGIGTITIGTDRLVASGIAFLILLTALLFIIKTMWGKRMQAVAQNRYGASIAGIETAKARCSCLLYLEVWLP